MRKSYIVALGIAVAASGWILSGAIFGDGSEAPAAREKIRTLADAAPKPIPQVRVAASKAQRHTAEIVLRGRTEPSRIVVVKAETEGRVTAVPTPEGALVAPEDTIVRLDEGDRPSRLRQTQAEVRQRQIEYDAAKKLSKKGLQSRTKLAEATALLQRARADRDLAMLEVERTEIVAPFAGVLEDRPVEIGDYLQKGNAVATIVDLDPVLVVAGVSERDRQTLRLGARAAARLVTGERMVGAIRFISANGSAETRTFRVELAVPNVAYAIPGNMTAEILLETEWTFAHRISPSILTLSDAGAVGVKIVDADSIVRFLPVEIVAEDEEGLLVRGLPDEAMLVTVGGEFVTSGQRVEPIAEPAPGPADAISLAPPHTEDAS